MPALHGGGYRFVEFDELWTHGEFTGFNLNGVTQMTCVTKNLSYCEPARDPARNFTLGASPRPFLYAGKVDPAFYESLSGRPLVANITNATSFTVPLLLAFLFLLPHAGVLARRYGWIASASEDHQRDHARESSRTNAHSIPYKRLPHGAKKTPPGPFLAQGGGVPLFCPRGKTVAILPPKHAYNQVDCVPE